MCIRHFAVDYVFLQSYARLEEQKRLLQQAEDVLQALSGAGKQVSPPQFEDTLTESKAETDKATPLNLTNHAYFNLNGYDGKSVMDQYLRIDADTYTAVDEDLIPVGDPVPVEGTDFDFRAMRKVGLPFDHNFNLNWNGMIRVSAEMYDEESGRTMTMLTNMPCVQLYTGCVMNGEYPFKGGVPQRPLHALCLETQYAPNSPNRPDFPSCILRPGEKYDFQTAYCFGVKK